MKKVVSSLLMASLLGFSVNVFAQESSELKRTNTCSFRAY